MPLTNLAAVCILDAGNGGITFKADHVLGASEHAHVMAGPQAHWAKIAFERFFSPRADAEWWPSDEHDRYRTPGR